MGGNCFTFRQFTVQQDSCAMKVGTDGVLLGAWANGGQRILDIGTGTGLIAMMMAQRCDGASVTAVEIDGEAALQARQNISMSPFAERISVETVAIQDFSAEEPFDCIVSNPPYFVDALKNPDAQRATARHTDTLTYRQLFAAVKRLLADDGEFSAVIPAECLRQFIGEAYLAGLAMSRQCAIRTTPRKQPKRYLVAFRHAHKNGLPQTEEQCLQQADGLRSEWYAAITRDFYIK